MEAVQYPKSWKKVTFANVNFNLLVIQKHFSMFLTKDHAHMMDIAYKPFYNLFMYML